MPLQKLPVQNLDDLNHRRRAREVLNQVLDHTFDDSKVQTKAEVLAGITPVNPAFASHEGCGFVLPERYGAVGNGDASDIANGVLDTDAINKAITISSATNCPVLISRQYIAVPATASTQEGAAITVAWLMQTNMSLLGVGGASITLANGQSTDVAPKSVALFHTNSVLSNISWRGVIFDMNGANNPISPGRPTVYERSFNMAPISVSGTPGGLAARVNDVVIEDCTFMNNPGACNIVAGQSNSTGVLLGERWTINNNLFLNNGLDTSDHTAIFGWSNAITCEGNIFWNDSPPHTVGLTGGSTCFEVHGSHHRVTNNFCYHYKLGMYIASNFSTEVIDTIIAHNVIYCSDYGILFLRQQTPASAVVDGALIDDNTFYFDNYTYSGQSATRAGVWFQGQISTQQLAINDIKITGNRAICVGTDLYSNFVRWDTVVNVGSNVCSNVSITDNQVIGFTEGVYILTNVDNGMGYTKISNNEFIELTPDSLTNPPMGIHINAGGGFTTLVIDGNQFIDDRGVPQFNYGIYLDSGTITDLYLGPQVYKGIATANYTEAGGLTVTNWLGPQRSAMATITYSASMTPNASAGKNQVITATNNSAFTINAPIRPRVGDDLTIKIRNTSGGALGAATWDAVFGMSAWTQPATGFSRSITFHYDGSLWIEISRTPADVAN